MNERYSRQILFDKIGEKGQENIAKSNVTIVGMGALGTHVAEQLTRSGIARLNIIDRDYVEVSNLQRQTLFTESDIKEMLPKVVAAEKHLRKIKLLYEFSLLSKQHIFIFEPDFDSIN